ncbi:initiator tRNA phosphoribosyl transferase-domain-containing protein [Chaetomium tenue]|uniref:Initiator tRNA phosphoribosyl transferase-domain-containing protein n=1 Tax=Chaetomium tenue TaxID=1854479 RepID=A0ACB7PDM2_9PEZI|nr:initiator tRNA phosphoribosyl transferase-domain-containing protein [Chaetomium globosum]
MPPPTLDQIIFPEQASQNFSHILGDLKRSNFITNRLASISQDAAFVEKVADALKLPLVANERCGSWYIDPARKAGSAYFKSTDGHTGQWKFSSRRLNLHLLELIGENNGCIIVDSTRRGKPAGIARLREAGFLPVVCCTASRRAGAGEVSEGGGGGYVQGAGDDTENWAGGLTPGGGEMAEREGGRAGVKEVVSGKGRGVVFVGGLGADVSSSPAEFGELGEGVCVVRVVPRVMESKEWVRGKGCLEVGLGKSKTASRLLRDALPQVCEFVLAFLRRPPAAEEVGALDKKVVVLCESGKDLSVGVALAIYCWCFDDAGNVRQGDEEVSFNKAAIRVRLGHIVTALPEANPSRATLQSVNSFLMDWRK